MDIDWEEPQPARPEPEEPWLEDGWFDEPWLGAEWTQEPRPPAWAPPDAVPRAVAARRQKVLEELGRAALHLRLARRWTQRDLELASGVDQTTISRLERGQQRGMSIRALAAILEALKTGRIQFLPPKGPEPTALDLMLYGDRWKRSEDAANRRLARWQARQRGRSGA